MEENVWEKVIRIIEHGATLYKAQMEKIFREESTIKADQKYLESSCSIAGLDLKQNSKKYGEWNIDFHTKSWN